MPTLSQRFRGPFTTAFLTLGASVFAQQATAPAGRGAPDFVPQKPEFLESAAKLRATSDPIYGHAQVEELRRKLAAEGLALPARLKLLSELSLELLRFGDNKTALETIEKALELARERPELDRAFRVRLLRVRAVVHLRRAEVANCIERHNSDCCIFPLKGGGVHASTEPAANARADFLEHLKQNPADLRSRWLVNLLSMALGDYPDGLAAELRIPAAPFESGYDIKRFPDRAPALGVATFNLAGGVVVEDFDHDGWLDLATSTCDPEGGMTLLRNTGAGAFENRSAPSRLDDQLGGLNCVGTDYDNDGFMDVLLLRGGWLQDSGKMRKSLLRNNRDGTFTDVTRAAGLADPAFPCQTAAWADYDNDGDLDVFFGHESRVNIGESHANYPSSYFRNNGDGTFTDATASTGLANDRYAKGAAAGDYDNDGDMDLYVSNVGMNRLYRNNGDGTFTDVAVELGVTKPDGRSFATWFFDYDNDGWLDIWVGAYQSTLEDQAAEYLGQPHKALLPCLYHNEQGRFVNVTREMGLEHVYIPMGANFGDLDNDGYLDMHLTTGDPHYGTLVPNVMLRNDAAKKFQDVTVAGGFGHLQKGHGVAFADFDHDGDQDIYHVLGGFYPGDKFHNVLFENPGHGNRFLVVDTVGTKTNRRGVGVRIKVVVRTAAGVREIHRAVGSVSSFGGSPWHQEIGLGDATKIERLEIDWPTSKTKQVFDNVPLDAAVRVVEGAANFERIEYRAAPFALSK